MKKTMKPKPITARLPDVDDDGPMVVQIHAQQVEELPPTLKNQLHWILTKLQRIRHKQRKRQEAA